MCLWKNKYRRYVLGTAKAGLTVECSLIMPVLLAAILLVIYLSIYTHDCVVIEYAALHPLYDEYRFISSDEYYMEEQIETEIEGFITMHLIGKWEKIIDVSVAGDEICVDIDATMQNSQGLLHKLTGDFGMRKIINERKHINPESSILRHYDL